MLLAFEADVARTADETDTVNHLALPQLFIVATYLHPLTRVDTPLPLHAWVLDDVHAGGPIRQGETSDAEGRSVIRVHSEDHGAGKEWKIGWCPWLAPGQPLPFAGNFDAWLDLDKNEWVQSKDVKAIEKRKLLRLESWTSTDKAKTGGFFESFSDEFAKTGVVKGPELAPIRLAHGSRRRAFHVKVDFEWFRSRVQLVYYNVAAKKTMPVPPGIVLKAEDRDRALVGAGTALEEDGTIFVLHHRTREQSPELHYSFETPKEYTLVDLTPATPSVEFKPPQLTPPTPPGKPQTRYLLPEKWHTRGWQAAIVDRVKWDEDDAVRVADTLASPLRFNLDDALLVDEDKDPIELDEGDEIDITVFDHLLVIRDKRNARPHVSGPPLEVNYLPAERYVVQEGKDLRGVTRVYDFDSRLHDLRELRRDGTPNEVDGLGMRVAVHNDHGWVDYNSGKGNMLSTATYELHLFDTPIDDYEHPSAATGAKVACRLFHLMPYSSAHVDTGDAPAGTDELLLGALDSAANVWNPGHPSAATGHDKIYGLVPDAGLEAGSPLVLVRHFFSQRRAYHAWRLVIELHSDISAKKDYRAHYSQFGRLHIGPRGIVPKPAFTHTDPDNMSADWHTLPHELGHSLGLIDEYEERLEGTSLPQFSQFGEEHPPYRPFVGDSGSMMIKNMLPRLRYYWHWAHSINNEGAIGGPVGFTKMVPEHPTFPGGALTFRLPDPGNMADQANQNPWRTLGDGELDGGHAKLILYRMGADESATGGLFAGINQWLPLNTRFDGVLVVRIELQFTADIDALAAFGANQFDAVFVRQRGKIDRHKYTYVITAPSAPVLRHVAIVMQPVYRLGTSILDPADVNVEVLSNTSTESSSLLLDPADRPSTLRMRFADVGVGIARHALGLPTFVDNGGVRQLITAGISGAEFETTGLIRFLQQALGEAPGTARTVVNAS